jgi:drug/metabolite transporter (DMT)-like permease
MLFYIILLALSSTIWGFGFIATKFTLISFGPFWAHALRFIIAGILGIPFLLYKKSFKNSGTPWLQGFIAASFLTGTLLFQTLGISKTTIAKSGFITTLYSFFVPLTLMVIYRKKFRNSFWFLVLMALFGMALLCNLEVTDLNVGDLLILVCSMFASFHIIYIGIAARRIKNPVEFNFIQNIFVGLQGIILAIIFEGKVNLHPLLDFNSKAFKSIIFLSVISSMIAFTVQVVAQKKIPTHIASLIFLLESPFAAWFGYIYLNERLNLMNLMGAGLILLSVILVPILGREVTTSTK